jgi:hypothetical protein
MRLGGFVKSQRATVKDILLSEARRINLAHPRTAPERNSLERGYARNPIPIRFSTPVFPAAWQAIGH